MAALGLVFGLLTIGYVAGVWTACVVFRESQSTYEDGVPALRASPANAWIDEVIGGVERAV
jgi:hypothetical protein